MGLFCSPYAPVLLIDEAVQLKISFVSKRNAVHMNVAVISSLHHIVSECLSCINESSAEGLPRLNFVWIEV